MHTYFEVCSLGEVDEDDADGLADVLPDGVQHLYSIVGVVTCDVILYHVILYCIGKGG